MLLLLNNEANVNTRCLESKTPLYYACRSGDINKCKLLISYCADITIGDIYEHKLPLDLLNKSKQDIIKQFIEDKKRCFTAQFYHTLHFLKSR